MNNRISAIEQLRQLRQQNDSPFGKEGTVFPKRPAGETFGKEKSPSKWNWDHWFRQERAEGAVQSEIFENELRNERDREMHQDDMRTLAEKYGYDVLKLIVNEATERRAQRQFQNSECNTCIETLDAFETAALHYRRKMEELEIIMKDDLQKDKLLAECRLVFGRMLTKIRINAYGLKNDPNGFGLAEEV